VAACTSDGIPGSADGASSTPSTDGAAQDDVNEAWGPAATDSVGSSDAAGLGDSSSDGLLAPGATACIDDARLGLGIGLGQVFPNVNVRRCEFEEIPLHDEICGHPLTLVDVGSAAFRPCVEATDAYVQDPELLALRSQGLHVVQVFSQDYSGQIPTTVFCNAYVEEHAIDFPFFIDPVGETEEWIEWHPFNAVLDSEGRVLEVWAGFLPEDRTARLEALLNAQ
jgi:hypothetical protein